MIPFKRPMLAASLLKPDDIHTDESILSAMQKLRYPVLATLKKDGIRAIRLDDLYSRTLNLIPNVSIRIRSMKLPYGFDMELWNPELTYDEVESIVMSEEHEDSDKIQFHVLDWFSIPTYSERTCNISEWFRNCCYERNTINRINKDVIWCGIDVQRTPEQLLKYFISAEELGGEGVCFRTPDSPYKQGRSTLNEQYLIKLARYIRQEVTIVGLEEQMLNNNTKKQNALGLMDRASHKAALQGKGILGAFIVQDSNGLQFRVGTGVGLTDARRADIWYARDKYVGKQITIKHKPHGQKIKPRSPIFVGFREEGY